MRACIGVLVFLATFKSLSAKYVESTLSVFDEMEDLKQQIKNKIYLKRPAVNNQYMIEKHPEEVDRYEHYEYVEDNQELLKPLRANDERLKKNLGFLKPLKTTSTTEEGPSKRFMLQPIRRRDMLNVTGPAETNVSDSRRSSYYWAFPELRDKQLSWVQNRVLITPFLTGQITNASEYNEVGMNNHIFLRFMDLLTYNTSSPDPSDATAILTQIFQLKIRLFLWQMKAITTLLNLLIQGDNHSFAALKHGLKLKFKQWHLDTSANEDMLRETKIFRPPCINWRQGGSTKELKRKTMTPPVSPTTRTPCPSSGENAEGGLREGDMQESADGQEAGDTPAATEAAVALAVAGAATVALPTVDPNQSDRDDQTSAQSRGSESGQRVDRTVIEWVRPRARPKSKGSRGKKRRPKHHRHKLSH